MTCPGAGDRRPRRIGEVIRETIHAKLDLVLADRQSRQAAYFQAVAHAHEIVIRVGGIFVDDAREEHVVQHARVHAVHLPLVDVARAEAVEPAIKIAGGKAATGARIRFDTPVFIHLEINQQTRNEADGVEVGRQLRMHKVDR